MIVPPGMLLVLAGLVFAMGACIGSFLNVCIHRIPREESIVAPRSRCPACLVPIPWFRNIPVLSYLALRGRCAKCGAVISPRYLLVELLTGALFILVWARFGFNADGLLVLDPRILVYWLFISGLLLGTFVDFAEMIIPDRVSIGGMVAGLICSALVPTLHGELYVGLAIQSSALGLAAGFLTLWLVGVVGKLIFRKEAMGFGDVKLLGAIGAFLGWKAVLFTIFISSLAGSLVGVGLIVLGRKEWQSRIPYGPYLALAAIIWVLGGSSLWSMYIAWLSGVPL